MKRALIVVDIQYDFLPGGALAVRDGDKVIPVANAMLKKDFDVRVATQDWHPPGHGSFAANRGGKVGEVAVLAGLPQVLWPDHCVQETHGADLHRDLDLSRVMRVFRKGTDAEIDSYSGFYDNGHRKSTGMGEWLKEQGVTDVFILGLATDYCVKYSALDAVKLGFRTHVIEDGCRGVELKPGDVAAAIEEMRKAGAEIIQSAEVR